MRIGFVQFRPVLGDPGANRAAAADLIDRAQGADLLVLPELSNSGYNFDSREEAMAAAEPLSASPFVDHLQRLSGRHRVFLVAGLCEREGDRLFNSSVLVGPEGLIGHYRKAHLFLNEKSLFSPGDLAFPVFDLDLGRLSPERSGEACRVGMLICFDWQFPEVWRILALRGAQVACHPSNLVLPGKAQRAVPVHALLNRLFVVTANRIGTERGLAFTGGSLIVAPSGEVLAQAGADADEVMAVMIDPAEADNKQVTARNNLITDRRPELYGLVVEDAGEAASGGAIA